MDNSFPLFPVGWADAGWEDDAWRVPTGLQHFDPIVHGRDTVAVAVIQENLVLSFFVWHEDWWTGMLVAGHSGMVVRIAGEVWRCKTHDLVWLCAGTSDFCKIPNGK